MNIGLYDAQSSGAPFCLYICNIAPFVHSFDGVAFGFFISFSIRVIVSVMYGDSVLYASPGIPSIPCAFSFFSFFSACFTSSSV